MSTSTVYRVEYPYNGFGPYRNLGQGTIVFARLRENLLRHNELTGRPVPSLHHFCNATPPGKCRSESVCGFGSMDELKNWFDGSMDELKRAGFKIARYHVPKNHIVQSANQTIFYRGNKTPVYGEI